MVNPKLKDEMNDQLCEAMLSLQTIDECYQFFEDICTISELKAMSQRLEVARMLRQGHTYDDIVVRTGASTATISSDTSQRISACPSAHPARRDWRRYRAICARSAGPPGGALP